MSPIDSWRGAATPKAPGPAAGVGRSGSEDRRTDRYRQAKENEARRDGRADVGVLHSTAEAGELDHEDPVEGRESRVIDCRRETQPELRVRALCPRNDDRPRLWSFRAHRDGVPMT